MRQARLFHGDVYWIHVNIAWAVVLILEYLSGYLLDICSSVSGSDICSSKADGVHGTHCADEYTRCSNGHAFTMKCPAGLVFSPKAAACELPSPECSSKSIQGVMPPVASADQTLTQVIGIHSSGMSMPLFACFRLYFSFCSVKFSCQKWL